MKKPDVISYAEMMSTMGYVTHPGLLDKYGDQDDIPGDVVDMVVHKANVRPMVLYGSVDLMALLNRNDTIPGK